MSLLIDIGNTRIKIGYADPDGIRQTSHSVALTHDQLHEVLPWLRQHGLQPSHALGISVASVQLKNQLEQLLQQVQCDCYWLDSTTPCPLLQNQYENPQQLGSDRWLGLIGVLALHHHTPAKPIIHISFGTATTIDTAMPATNQHTAQFIGGLILPGPQLMYDSLALNTAQLGAGQGDLFTFPKNTRAAISSGIAGAQAGAMLRQWYAAFACSQQAPLVVCSGGGWDLVKEEVQNAYLDTLKRLQLPHLPIIEQATPVLDGLAYMATQMRLTLKK